MEAVFAFNLSEYFHTNIYGNNLRMMMVGVLFKHRLYELFCLLYTTYLGFKLFNTVLNCTDMLFPSHIRRFSS
jgi:hypothetical protein